MVGKNNNYVRESKSNEHFQRFALRKLSVGVVSVAVAAGFYLGSGTTAQAATTEPDTSAKTEQVVQQDAKSTASDAVSASNASAAVSASSTVPTSAEPVSKVTASDSAVSASSASVSQVLAANASESSSQPVSSSVASNTAATVSKDSQAASEANSPSAADVETAQLPTSAANANESKAANILSAQDVQKAANQQAPAGFTVTDPTYPAEMYKDPDASHYTYWWAQSSNGQYNLVLSTDRSGDGKVYVLLLGNNNNVLGRYTVDKNNSVDVSTYYDGDLGTVYNDGQSGVFVSAKGTWKSKFNVFGPQAGEDNGNYGSISFMIPQVETQTTTYVDGKGNTVSDPVVQKGLDGQHYATKGGKVIGGYFAKKPSNANGYMSPFGKQGATYTKDWHNGLKATFTETDTKTGLMHVVVEYHGEEITNFDLAPGQSKKVDYDFHKSVTIHSIYIQQTINIEYVYEKLGNLIIKSDSDAFPAENKTTTQYPNDENDSTKAGNVKIPEVPGFTPTINGKTVTNYTFNPTDYVSDLSQDITVVYTADAQEATINFYDETDHKQLDNQTIHLTGKTGEKVDRTQADKTLADLEKQGYVLDEDNTKLGFPADATYDNDDAKPQEFTIYLKHDTTHTSATDEKADQKTVTETIHYVYKDGVKAGSSAANDYTDSVTFKRGYTTDKVTGKIVSYDPWTVDGKQADNKTFDAVKSPAIAGYTADVAQVDAATVTPDSENVVKTVYYTADAQEAQAIFYDETTGKEISNTREFATGKTDETIGFTKDPNEVVKELEKQGYVFDKDNANNNVFAAGTTYDKNSEVHQYFKYYFTHATTTVTPDNPKTPADVLPDNPGKNYPSGVAKDDLNKTVTRTINITTPDGKTQTITQKAEFTRSATVDEVTGEVTYGPWSKNVVLESVDVPNIPGYVPSASVPEITVTPNDQDMTINITYKKLDSGKAAETQGGNASNGGQATNGGSTTGQAAQNGQSGQTQNNAGAQQLPQTGNANNEKGALGLAGAMFAAGLGLGFGSKKKRHEN